MSICIKGEINGTCRAAHPVHSGRLPVAPAPEFCGKVKRHEEMISLLSFYTSQWEAGYPSSELSYRFLTTLLELIDVYLVLLHKE